MKGPIKLQRPLDKILYRPLSIQAERQQGLRDNLIKDRMAASSVRPEKRNGLVRTLRTR